MDIFESIRADHVLMRDMLNQLTDRGTGPTGDRDWATLVHDLKIALVGHARAEEEVVYPLLHDMPGRAAMEKAKTAEHHMAEEFLKDLERLDPADDDWSDKLAIFRNALIGHIEEEETTLFPILRDALDDDRALRLAEEFETMLDDVRLGAPYHPKGQTELNPSGLDLTR